MSVEIEQAAAPTLSAPGVEIAAGERRMLTPAMKVFLSVALAHAMVDLTGGVWPVFKTLAGLDLYWAGLLATVATATTAAIQPVFGFYADRGHHRLLIVGGLILSLTLLLLGPVATYGHNLPPITFYGLLFLILLLSRLGGSMFHPPGTSMAGNASAARRSMLVGLFIACGMSGFALSAMAFSVTWKLTDGNTQWLLLLLLPPTVLVWAWCRPPVIHRETRLNFLQVLVELGHVRGHLLALFLIQVCTSATAQGIFFLLPEFVEARGYPIAMQHWGAFLLMILGAVPLMIWAGHVADRWNRKAMLVAVLALTVMLYHFFVQLPTLSLPLFILLCLVTGGFLSTGPPIAVAIAQHMAPRSESMISGVMMGLAWAVGSLAPAVVGYLAQNTGLGVVGALTWLGVANLLALVLALMLPRNL